MIHLILKRILTLQISCCLMQESWRPLMTFWTYPKFPQELRILCKIQYSLWLMTSSLTVLRVGLQRFWFSIGPQRILGARKRTINPMVVVVVVSEVHHLWSAKTLWTRVGPFKWYYPSWSTVLRTESVCISRNGDCNWLRRKTTVTSQILKDGASLPCLSTRVQGGLPHHKTKWTRKKSLWCNRKW